MNEKIIIYPGRFQPFGPHHFAAYQHLCSKFGANNIYITTSNKLGEKSPLNYSEKIDIITQYGISKDNVVQVSNPYKVGEISEKLKLNPNNIIIYAIGKKDIGRISTYRPESYFKEYNPDKLNSLSVNGYVYYIPTIKKTIPGYGTMSGTTLRKFISNSTQQQFKLIFGWFNSKIYSNLKKRICNLNEVIVLPIEIGDIVYGGKFKNKKIVVKTIDKNEKGDIVINGKPLLRIRIPTNTVNENGVIKHIQHPYNDVNLTFSNLNRIIKSLLSGNSEITNVTEKIDGQSLSITYKNGSFLSARNKTTIINPMDIYELEDLLPTIEVKNSFINSFKFLTTRLSELSDSLLNKFFKDGKIFLNIELVNPITKNVIEYNSAYIILLNMYEYDSDGNCIREIPNTTKLFSILDGNSTENDTIKIINSISIKLPNNIRWLTKFNDKLDKIKGRFNLSADDNFGKLLENGILYELPKIRHLPTDVRNRLIQRWVYSDKSIRLNTLSKYIDYDYLRKCEDQFIPDIIEKYTLDLEILFLELGNVIIPTIRNMLIGKDNIKDLIKDSIKYIKKNGTAQQIQMFKHQWDKIKILGGIDKIYPCEGIVFTFNDKRYKLTGMFAPINQLLGTVKYNL